MIVNHSRRFIFYHVPKTAGSSIRAALWAAPGSRKPRGSKHLAPVEYLSSLNSFQRWRVRNYFTFCFVRDPFERFGSAHRYLLNHEVGRRNNCPTDVNEFALLLEAGKEWVVNLHSMVPQAHYADHVSFVGRYETLNADFATICDRLKINIPLGHVNWSGETTSYSSAFTPETRAILTRHFQEDFGLA